MQAHFGAVTFDIAIGPDIEMHAEGLVGETLGYARQINIRTKTEEGEPVSEAFGRDTLLHELLHAACRAAGFGHPDEEAMVNAIGAGLHQLLEDERNQAVISRLIPWATLAPAMRITTDKIGSGAVVQPAHLESGPGCISNGCGHPRNEHRAPGAGGHQLASCLHASCRCTGYVKPPL